MSGHIATPKKQDWCTPENVLVPVRRFLGPIDLDPCGHPDSTVGAAHQFLLPLEDGLKLPWGGQTFFVNPPFADMKAWAERCVAEAQAGFDRHIVLLVPAKTDTLAWQQSVFMANAICYWKGRIRFVGAEQGAPMACALAYWGSSYPQFRRIFSPYGHVEIIP